MNTQPSVKNPDNTPSTKHAVTERLHLPRRLRSFRNLTITDHGSWGYRDAVESFDSGTPEFDAVLRLLVGRHRRTRCADRDTFPAHGTCRRCSRDRKNINAMLGFCGPCIRSLSSDALFRLATFGIQHAIHPDVSSQKIMCRLCQRRGMEVERWTRCCQPCFEALGDEMIAELILPALTQLEKRRISGALKIDLTWQVEFGMGSDSSLSLNVDE
jgi:hypothetical protein